MFNPNPDDVHTGLITTSPSKAALRAMQGFRAFDTARFGNHWEATGQTIAGIASAGGVMLVWTGVALSLRRFAAWRRRRHAVQEPELVEHQS